MPYISVNKRQTIQTKIKKINKTTNRRSTFLSLTANRSQRQQKEKHNATSDNL